MRVIHIIVLIVTYLTVHGQSTKWTDFEKAWDNYLSKPTHDNAIKVYKLLPDKIKGGDFPDSGQTGRVFSKIDQLDQRVQQGDRDAIRLAFKLFTIADGGYAEGLQIKTGKLINTSPRLFLQELKNHRQLIVSLDGLVGNLGPDYVDELELEKKEIEARIKSLKQIGDKDLTATRNECLKELGQQLKRSGG